MAQDAPPQTLCQKETPTAISGHVVKLLNYQFGMLKKQKCPSGQQKCDRVWCVPIGGHAKIVGMTE